MSKLSNLVSFQGGFTVKKFQAATENKVAVSEIAICLTTKAKDSEEEKQNWQYFKAFGKVAEYIQKFGKGFIHVEAHLESSVYEEKYRSSMNIDEVLCIKESKKGEQE